MIPSVQWQRGVSLLLFSVLCGNRLRIVTLVINLYIALYCLVWAKNCILSLIKTKKTEWLRCRCFCVNALHHAFITVSECNQAFWGIVVICLPCYLDPHHQTSSPHFSPDTFAQWMHLAASFDTSEPWTLAEWSDHLNCFHSHKTGGMHLFTGHEGRGAAVSHLTLHQWNMRMDRNIVSSKKGLKRIEKHSDF